MAILALTETIYYSMSLFLRSVFKFAYSIEEIIGRHADKAKLTFRRPNEIFILAIFEESFQTVYVQLVLPYFGGVKLPSPCQRSTPD